MNTKVIYLGRNMHSVYLTCEGEMYVAHNGYLEPKSPKYPTRGHGTTNPLSEVKDDLFPGQIVKLTIQIDDTENFIPGRWYLARATANIYGTVRCYHYNGTNFCDIKDRRVGYTVWSANELVIHPIPIEHPFLEGQQ